MTINQNTISGVTECITEELYSICIEFYNPSVSATTFIPSACYNVSGGQKLIIKESDYIDSENICENNINIGINDPTYADFFEIENNDIIFNAPLYFNNTITLTISGIDCLNRVIPPIIIQICSIPLTSNLMVGKEIKHCENNQTDCSLDDLSINLSCDLTIITLSSETINGIVDNISGIDFTYTPKTGFTGNDIHTLTVSGDCLYGLLDIEINFFVNPYNLNAVNDFFRVQRLTGEILPVLDNDTYCCDENDVILEIISGATYGVASVISGPMGDRIVYNACDPCYVGFDAFIYSLTCGNVTDTASVCVDVICNEFNADSFMISALYCSATTIDIAELSNITLSPECDDVEFIFTKRPMFGTIENNNNGTITYYPNQCGLGDDLICGYLVDNNECKSNIINIDIVISGNPLTVTDVTIEPEIELDCDLIDADIINSYPILSATLPPTAIGIYACVNPTYSWYFESNLLPYTGDTITASTYGLYRVEIGCDNGCTYIGEKCIYEDLVINVPPDVDLGFINENNISEAQILYNDWINEFSHSGGCGEYIHVTTSFLGSPTDPPHQLLYVASTNCCGNNLLAGASATFQYQTYTQPTAEICFEENVTTSCGVNTTSVNLINQTISDLLHSYIMDMYVDIQIETPLYIYSGTSIPVSSSTLGCISGATTISGDIDITILPNGYISTNPTINPIDIFATYSFPISGVPICPIIFSCENLNIIRSEENESFSYNSIIGGGYVLRVYFMQGYAPDKLIITNIDTSELIVAFNASSWTTKGALNKVGLNGTPANNSDFTLCRSCDGVSGLTLLGDYFFRESEIWKWGNNYNYLINITDDQYITANTCATIYTYGINNEYGNNNMNYGYHLINTPNSECGETNTNLKSYMHQFPTNAITILDTWINSGNNIPYASENGMIVNGPEAIFSYVDIIFSATTNYNITVIDNSCNGGSDSDLSQWAILTECFPYSSITVTCPDDITVPSCQTEQEIQDSFDAWVNEFTYIGGCNVSDNKSMFVPPDICGGSIEYDYIAIDSVLGVSATCSATFTIELPPTIEANCPDDITIIAMNQFDVDVAFGNWINEFTYSGGCEPIITTNLNMFTAPDFCGGNVVVNYGVSGACQVSECEATFTVEDLNFTLTSSIHDDGFDPDDSGTEPNTGVTNMYHFCHDNWFPKISWCSVPEGTVSLLLIVELDKVSFNTVAGGPTYDLLVENAGPPYMGETIDNTYNVHLNAWTDGTMPLPTTLGPFKPPDPNKYHDWWWQSAFSSWNIGEPTVTNCDCTGDDVNSVSNGPVNIWVGLCDISAFQPHTYKFKLYALDCQYNGNDGSETFGLDVSTLIFENSSYADCIISSTTTYVTWEHKL